MRNWLARQGHTWVLSHAMIKRAGGVPWHRLMVAVGHPFVILGHDGYIGRWALHVPHVGCVKA